MENGGLTISEQNISRHHVLRMVSEGRMTLVEASRVMGVSYRQAKRLKKSFEQRGIEGLVHGNQGRISAKKTDYELCLRVVELSVSRYSDFNDTHFTEMLAGNEQIVLSRETVRKIRRDEGIRPKCKRRAKKHYKRRPRKANEGLMIIWDGSPHHWFGKEHPACCAMTAIDDATSKIVGLFFTQVECTWAYLELLRRVVKNYGIPVSVYQDRHSSLKRNDDFWSIEEELAGRREPTQVGIALESLGIEPIFATTPQAKGRVERLFKTLQDRLCAELRLEGISDIDSANDYAEIFRSKFNDQFGVDTQDARPAWRKPGRRLDLERILSFKYEAKVANDNAVRFDGIIIDIAPGPGKKSYAGMKAELRQFLDGSWRVYCCDKLVASAPASEIGEPIRAKSRRKGARAAIDSRWVYMSSRAQSDSSYGKSVRRAGPGKQIGATRIA